MGRKRQGRKPGAPARVIPLREELLEALQMLRAAGLDRAANRLERMSKKILNPKGALPKVKTRAFQMLGGSGRRFPVKLRIEE